MASKKSILSFFLIFSSFLHLGVSQLLPLGNMLCVEKLTPCQPYLKLPEASGTPPDTCCEPLKDMVAKEVACLCHVFNSPEMLQSMNVTKVAALKLPKACGIDADVSKCDKDASSSASSPIGGPAADIDEKGSNSTSSTTMIIPSGLVLTFALVFSADWALTCSRAS